MQKLSITQAWNETAVFVKRDLGPLFTIAFALMALPSIIMQALAPQPTPEDPDVGAAFLLLLPVVIVLSLVGSIAITALALRRETVVGSAIAHGFRRFLPLLGASLLIGIAAMLVMIPVILAAGISLEDLTAPTPAAVGGLMLAMLVLFVVFIAIWVRLMLMTPVGTNEPVGPIAIIRRSWALTAGHFWKLLGFVLLFGIAAVVVMMVITMVIGIVIGLVAGAPEPGSLSGLLLLIVGGVLNAAFVVFFTTMIARIYAQLAGAGTDAAVFD
ncbi:MAG: hypothetical protein ACK40O_13065 [Allosphingosinicella sp.]